MTIDQIAQRDPLAAKLDPDKCINLTKGGCEACGKVCFYGAIRFSPKLQPESGL